MELGFRSDGEDRSRAFDGVRKGKSRVLIDG